MHYCPYCLLDKNGIHFLEGHRFTNLNFYHIFLTVPYKGKNDIFALYNDLDKTFNMIDKPKELPGITTSIYKDINAKRLKPIDLHWYYQCNIKDSDELFYFKADTSEYPISPSRFKAHMYHSIADVYCIKEVGDYTKNDDRYISIKYTPNIPEKVYFFDNAGTSLYYYLAKRSGGIGLYRPIDCILEWYDMESNKYTIDSGDGFKNKDALYFITEKHTFDGTIFKHKEDKSSSIGYQSIAIIIANRGNSKACGGGYVRCRG